MAETDIHRSDMVDLIQILDDFYASDRMVYVSGNLLIFYEEGNRRKHVAPDVFVVIGVEKKLRENYLIWAERRAPDVVIELTSKSTKREDMTKKWELYRDVLKVREYFLFDPTQDYLDPPLQGHRLIGGQYAPIEQVSGRLPSEVLRLHLERHDFQLRLYDPATRSRLLTRSEKMHQVAAEHQRLLREVEALRRAQNGD
jgi:Uma2 family endonuclease